MPGQSKQEQTTYQIEPIRTRQPDNVQSVPSAGKVTIGFNVIFLPD